MEYIITEKNSTARRIAQILSGEKVKQKKIEGINVYQFDGRAVIGLSGHILGIDFPQEYNRWENVDAQDLVNAEVVTVPLQKKIISALKKIAKDANRIIIATDYDREGELIGVEALNIIKEVNPNVSVDRVRYSAITPAEIKKSFASPSKVDYNLASAAEARQIIDLIWGASLTRFISLSARSLGNNFLSVGRVQSPTLALLVEREKEIESFVPKAYWEISAVFNTKKGKFEATHEKGRFWEKKEAESIVSNLGKKGTIEEVKKSEKRDRPPIPFNTTEFLSEAASIGYSAANAMRIAENLYINGYISYPRTDNTVYPKTLDLKEIINMFVESEFEEHASLLLLKRDLKPTAGKKETHDHPPIYPVSVAKRGELKEDEWKIYELVVRRFFATFADPAVWEVLKVKVNVDGEMFRENGLRIIEPGWRFFYPYRAQKERILPDLKEGEEVEVKKIEILEKETKPPRRFGQGKLIKRMEELGLGTKSTRHEIISKLYARAYVHGNPLKPTKKGIAVTESLEKYAELITKPDMTAKLEKYLDEISEGKIDEKKVIEESRKILGQVFEKLKKEEEEISESLRKGLREDKIVGECPECGSELIIRRSKRGLRFIGCSKYPECTFTLPLPKKGKIVVTEKKCEEHGLNEIQIINKGKRPWSIGCPYCNFLKWRDNNQR
ncbi:MAG: DNA topoisomerase I [Candidatus Syntropharchaeia archaeon]